MSTPECCALHVRHGARQCEKVKSADRQETMFFFDMYRRGQSSEVQRKVSLVLCSTPVSAKCSARRGQPQLQWQCEQRGLQRQLLVVHAQWFGQRLEPQLQFGRSEHEQQQSVQRAIRASRPSLYQQDGHTPR